MTPAHKVWYIAVAMLRGPAETTRRKAKCSILAFHVEICHAWIFSRSLMVSSKLVLAGKALSILFSIGSRDPWATRLVQRSWACSRLRQIECLPFFLDIALVSPQES